MDSPSPIYIKSATIRSRCVVNKKENEVKVVEVGRGGREGIRGDNDKIH